MINTKRPNTDNYTQVGFIEAKDNQGNYQNIDKIYDNQGNIVFQQGYLNEYQGADDFGIPAIGKPLVDYTIWGNSLQSDTPTPDNPIEPEFVGEKTENLLEIIPEMKNKDNWHVTPMYSYFMYYHLSDSVANELRKTGNIAGKVFLRAGGSYYNRLVFIITPTEIPTGVGNEFRLLTAGNALNYQKDVSEYENIYLGIGYGLGITSDNKQTLIDALFDNWDIMLVSGTTVPTSYQPYGYKIPISSAGQTKNIYLGQVQTTRRIKKMVLTGKEEWQKSSVGYNGFYFGAHTKQFTDMFCNIAVAGTKSEYAQRPWVAYNDGFAAISTDPEIVGTTVASFKSWLAERYANGNPVIVWAIRSSDITSIVNEPLCRIGDYADSVNFSQAGVEIPTLKKPNTTVIDVETSLEPSEVDVKYRGLTKPKYDLFLAKNGDPFEAKDGQSLYIGGNV